MLSRVPPELLASIVNTLNGPDLICLWMSGDSLLLTKLRNGLRSLKLPWANLKSFQWPSKLIQSFPNLTKLAVDIEFFLEESIVHNIDLTVLPKGLRSLRLHLSSWSSPISAPLAQLLPNLEELSLRVIEQLPLDLINPWPASLRQLHLDSKRTVGMELLCDLPPSLIELKILATVWCSGLEPVIWPNLTVLRLSLRVKSLTLLASLPSTLQEFILDLDPSEGCLTPKLDIWSTLPDSLTQISIFSTSDYGALIDPPMPEQLLRMTSLKWLTFENALDDQAAQKGGADITRFWKNCPSLEHLQLPSIESIVTDLNVIFLPRNYRSCFVDMAGTHDSAFNKFSESSLALLPLGIRKLTIRCHSPDLMPELIVPTQLTELEWSPRAMRQTKFPFNRLPPNLRVLKASRAFLEPNHLNDSSLSYLPQSLKSLHVASTFFPRYGAGKLLPDGLKSLFFEHDTQAQNSKLPRIWNIMHPFDIPMYLTHFRLSIRLDEVIVTKDFVDWVEKIPFELMTSLVQVSLDLGFGLKSSKRGLSEPSLQGRPIGEPVLRKLQKSKLRQLSLVVQCFDLSLLQLLPRELSHICFHCLDDSFTQLTPDHLAMFPRLLQSIRFHGQTPTLTSHEWRISGLPAAMYLSQKFFIPTPQSTIATIITPPITALITKDIESQLDALLDDDCED